MSGERDVSAATAGPTGPASRAGVRTVTAGGRSPGEAVLDECAALGADLLVKGAYTQSRLRQLVFGGATRHIMMNAGLPVILAH